MLFQKPVNPGESREIREMKDCLAYVPILDTLQRLLENEDVVTQVHTLVNVYHTLVCVCMYIMPITKKVCTLNAFAL